MKYLKFVLPVLFIFTFGNIQAQQNHFIYIQTESKQPFYVKLNNKLYSSSASGHLLISKLKEGVYNMAIGFPKTEWSEQNLSCTVGDKDLGYLLKNFGEKGWGLFNLQSLDVIMAGQNQRAASIEVVNQTDAFSTMLSSVVNDSTIRQTEVVKQPVKKEPVKEVVTQEPDQTQEVPVVTKASVPGPVQEPVKEKMTLEQAKEILRNSELQKTASNEAKAGTSVIPTSEVTAPTSIITRSLINKNVDGTEMVFVDNVEGKKDTIRLFIPADKNVIADEKQQPVEAKAIEKTAEATTGPEAPKKAAKKADSRFLEVEVPRDNQVDETKKVTETKTAEATVETKVSAEKPAEVAAQKPVMINSDCKSLAGEDDFLKLRKKMAAEDNDDDMIALAKKSFKAKCFTVEQVKNLSVLFLKDAGKYAFFDMAYPFVSDSHNFNLLQGQLSETYYISRFQAMIRH